MSACRAGKGQPLPWTSWWRVIATGLLCAGAGLAVPGLARADTVSSCGDIRTELDYITNSSWTDEAWIYRDARHRLQPAYGVINDWRIGDGAGADFVRVGEASMAVIGMIDGVKAIDAQAGVCSNPNRSLHVSVIQSFFWEWLANWRDGSPNSDGSFPSQFKYDRYGQEVERWQDHSIIATAQVLLAMTKFAEWTAANGDSSFREQYYDMAHRLADFLGARYDGSTRLVADNGNAWVGDNAFTAVAWRNFARWADRRGDVATRDWFNASAGAIEGALEGFKDAGSWHSFYRVKHGSGAPGYDGVFDQLGFVPYETGALPASQSYAGLISDFWTSGSPWGTTLTNQWAGWTYFGTRWHVYEGLPPGDDLYGEQQLYPGPGLQLAKVEWAHYQASGNPVYRLRAQNRLAFARNSGLWYAAPARDEGGIAAGFNDWRNEFTGMAQPQDYKRFIDTSAYFIQAIAMIELGRSVSYHASP